jgi:hypothetical protein
MVTNVTVTGTMFIGKHTYEQEAFPNNFGSPAPCGGVNKLPSATNYQPFYQPLATKIALIFIRVFLNLTLCISQSRIASHLI